MTFAHVRFCSVRVRVRVRQADASNESWMRSSMMTAPSIPHYSLVANPPSLLAWWAYSLRAPVYNFCFLHTFMLRSHMSMDINWQPFQYLLCCRNVWPLSWSPCYIVAPTMPLSACDLTSYCPNQKCLLHLLLSTEWPSEEQCLLDETAFCPKWPYCLSEVRTLTLHLALRLLKHSTMPHSELKCM